ncbi:hypothetical protein L0244_24190, partial [bacterium]|nr:hypothetical protein [bacterium]
GIPYFLKDGYDALLVPSNDAESMSAAVVRILNELGLSSKISKNARTAAERFDWSQILPQWESLFHSLDKKGLAETSWKLRDVSSVK